MIAVSYHDTVNDLQGADFDAAGPFSRAEWFKLLENAGKQPLCALARDGNRVAVMPLTFTGGRLQCLSNWYAFTWAPLMAGGGGDDLLAALARDLARKAVRIDLTRLADEDHAATRLQDAFAKAGWIVLRSQCDLNHVLPVAGRSYADYLAARPGKLRTILKRKAGRVDVRLTDRFADRDWADYEHIYTQSWKPEEGDPALLRQFAMQESDAGRYRFGMASHDGAPVAAQFWTVDSGTAYIHKLAHLENSRHLSAGTTLTAALFKQVIDHDHVQLVDFGTGDDPYKRDWMEQARPRFHLTCLRPAAPRNWPLLAKTTLRKLVSPAMGG